jgi:quercetin dioxygenase-like cupin family protein
MTIVHATNLHAYEGHGGQMYGLATSSHGATELSLWRTTMAVGASSEPQYHDHEEVAFILEGQGLVRIAGEVAAFTAGDTLIFPACCVHQVDNTAEKPLAALIVMPAGTRSFRPDGVELAPAAWSH